MPYIIFALFPHVQQLIFSISFTYWQLWYWGHTGVN